MLRVTAVILVIILALAACGPHTSRLPLVGDAAHGAELFNNGQAGAPACAGCHATAPTSSALSVAPNLSGFSQRAGQRVAEMSAHAYAITSIVDPGDFVVNGFPNVMYPQYARHLSPQDLADLVAYLMML